MWAEDAVFWSITQATEVNGFKPSLAESCHKFSKVGAGDLEADGCWLRGGQTLGITVPLKGTEHQFHKTLQQSMQGPWNGENFAHPRFTVRHRQIKQDLKVNL